MKFMAVCIGILRNPEILPYDKHKSFKVAESPTSGNYNPFWRQLGWPRQEKNTLEAAAISTSSKETKTERHSIPRISNEIFCLSVSVLLLCFDCHIFIAWQFSDFGKALETSLQTHMPEMPKVKYSSLISMNSSTKVSVPCTSSKSLIFFIYLFLREELQQFNISNLVKIYESQSIAKLEKNLQEPTCQTWASVMTLQYYFPGCTSFLQHPYSTSMTFISHIEPRIIYIHLVISPPMIQCCSPRQPRTVSH